MGNRVQRVKTEVSEAQMAQAIIDAWKKLFGKPPAKEQVAMILAQNALETNSRKAMWNNNVGNITTDGKGNFDYFDDLSTSEQVSPGNWKKMRLKYRSYPTLSEGVQDYLNLLSKSHNYASAWDKIVHPDPEAFSKALKAGGYYTANEAPYTRALTSLFSKYNNGNSYELAMSGKVAPPSAPSNEPTDLYSVLDKYLQQIAAADRSNKGIYKRLLPNNDILIKVFADTNTDAIEFSRILTSALDEEFSANSFTHTNGDNVEVQCNISGPSETCFNAVKQLTASIADAFEAATKKIGGIKIATNCIMDKRSSYQEIDLKTADSQYRRFLLKTMGKC
jgi:hypothetical protein